MANLRPYKKGQSGNPSGRPKKKPVTEIYEQILNTSGGRKAVKEAVLAMIHGKRMAAILTLREMAERVEGKVTQPVEVVGDLTILSDDELKKRLDASRKAQK